MDTQFRSKLLNILSSIEMSAGDRIRLMNALEEMYNNIKINTNNIATNTTNIAANAANISTMQTKLNTIEEGANNYSLPNASTTTRGGVLQGSAIADSSATDVTTLVTNFNSLLASLRAAGIIAQ